MDKRRKPAIREPRPHLTMEEMRAYLTSLREIESVTGIRYIKLHVTAKMIIGIREASGKEFTINLDDLFHAYNECLRFTSPEVKSTSSWAIHPPWRCSEDCKTGNHLIQNLSTKKKRNEKYPVKPYLSRIRKRSY